MHCCRKLFSFVQYLKIYVVSNSLAKGHLLKGKSLCPRIYCFVTKYHIIAIRDFCSCFLLVSYWGFKLRWGLINLKLNNKSLFLAISRNIEWSISTIVMQLVDIYRIQVDSFPKFISATNSWVVGTFYRNFMVS